MKRLFVVFAALIALAAPSAAFAHPLGNFTVNRFAAVELSGRDVFVHYVLDLAEIPTVQEGDRVRATGFDAEVADRLDLELDGRRAELVPVQHKVSERPGAGGLPTLRFEAVYRVTDPGDSRSLVFHDTNFAGRVGWREIVVRAADGVRLVSSDVPAESASDDLRAYPRDLLRSPLDVTSAGARFVLGPGPGTPPSFTGVPAPERSAGSFESLVERENLGRRRGPPVASHRRVLGCCARAEPRARQGDGCCVPGRLARDSAARALARPDRDRYAHGWRLRARARDPRPVGAHRPGAALSVAQPRFRAPRRGRGSERAARPPQALPRATTITTSTTDRSLRDLLAVGISGGLLPCPTALVVLLAAISLHRVGYGLVLIVAFSLGLAGAMTAVGLAAVSARRFLRKKNFEGRIVRALPAVSARADPRARSRHDRARALSGRSL